MALVKVTRNFQVSIPKEVRDALNIEEGDLVEVEARDGEIVMLPKKLIDADQAWFWTREWQKGEAQAEADIREGRLSGPFKSVDDVKKHFGDA
jgi:AbrB family looped-hinge helix DNA binding protein